MKTSAPMFALLLFNAPALFVGRRKLRRALGLLVGVVMVWPASSYSQWTTDGVPVCAASATQEFPAAISDGAGGAIVTWRDFRNLTAHSFDIYAQRISGSGVVQWATDGVAVCTVLQMQTTPVIVSDGAGGAIIAWLDYRTGASGIYAQRLDASGTPLWTMDGVQLSATLANPSIASDGAQGAIITYGNRAQRVTASGTTPWGADGVILVSSAAYGPTVVTSDGGGGAIVATGDRVQRVDALGTMLWGANGVAVCSHLIASAIISDGVGGAIVVGGGYAQRFDAAGVSLWPGGCVLLGAQDPVAIASDGAGGAITAWSDYRNFKTWDIYAQRVNADGVVQWQANGLPICTEIGTQADPVIASDSGGAAIVAWRDVRGGTYYDLYAQRVTPSGSILWKAGGIPICVAPDSQYRMSMVSDGDFGVIVAWEDVRAGIYEDDIYAQRVGPGGLILSGVGGELPQSTPSFMRSHPNPFASNTMIEFDLPRSANVSIDIFDAVGRRVRVLQLGYLNAGSRSTSFDGRDGNGHALPSGVYFYQLSGIRGAETRKMVLVK